MIRLSSLVILFIVFFSACKKETFTQTAEQVLSATAASKGGQPSPTSIVQWQKCIGSSSNDYGYCVAKALDGSGYFVAGTTETATNGRDVLVSKIDLNGTNVLWQKTFGGSGIDEGTSIVATADGGCLIAGKTTSNNGDVQGNKGGYDIWLMKLSASGDLDLSQSKTLGGSGYDITGQIIATSDGGYIIAGQPAMMVILRDRQLLREEAGLSNSMLP